jgi:hypothetical protein
LGITGFVYVPDGAGARAPPLDFFATPAEDETAFVVAPPLEDIDELEHEHANTTAKANANAAALFISSYE